MNVEENNNEIINSNENNKSSEEAKDDNEITLNQVDVRKLKAMLKVPKKKPKINNKS